MNSVPDYVITFINMMNNVAFCLKIYWMTYRPSNLDFQARLKNYLKGYHFLARSNEMYEKHYFLVYYSIYGRNALRKCS